MVGIAALREAPVILRIFVPALVASLLGCAGGPSTADLPAADAPAATPPTDVEKIGDAPIAPADGVATADGTPLDAPVTPESLYGACRERVEGVETAGECTTDADCAKVGCSQEVCVPAKLAGEIMTTCEVLPCFKALDTCGCNAGVCSWSLKSELPGLPGRLPLPPKPQSP